MKLPVLRVNLIRLFAAIRTVALLVIVQYQKT